MASMMLMGSQVSWMPYREVPVVTVSALTVTDGDRDTINDVEFILTA